jgi:general stress protein 26
MQDDDPHRPLTDLMEPGSTLMLAVQRSSADAPLEFRPMTVARVADEHIQILLDTDEEWVAAANGGDHVYVTLSDNRSNTWVSAEGELSLSFDEALIDELWNPAAEAFFDDGRQSRGIAVMDVAVQRGTYWSSPSGRLGSLISIVKSKFGDPEQSGQHGDVAV